MSRTIKLILLVLMPSALFFGFLHLFFPHEQRFIFDRLHIFLFNLVSGGTILLYFTQGFDRISRRVIAFLVLSIVYALFAFFNLYLLTVAVSVVLAAIVESVRIQKFSWFPLDFFDPKVPVSEKFHHAALLCLSLGLLIASLVILNNTYWKVFTDPELNLDSFFLGYSFPLSLITLSVMFSLAREDQKKMVKTLRNLGFWIVNLGVIIFFVFIIFNVLVAQLAVTSLLTLTVIVIFFIFRQDTRDSQQVDFLTSGMVFLLFTAVTGMSYIGLEFYPHQYTFDKHFLLELHAFVSLYGWNLSGFAVITRYNEFPIRLHSKEMIALHWLTVAVLAPLGYYHWTLAVVATLSFTVLIYAILFSPSPASGRGWMGEVLPVDEE